MPLEGDPGTTHQGWREGGELPADLEGGGQFTAGLEERGQEGRQGVFALLEEVD